MNNNKTTNIPTHSIDFGYELLRSHIFEQFLVNGEQPILYLSGKNVARQYPLSSDAEIRDFFSHANWGELLLEKEKKGQRIYSLSSLLIQQRFEEKRNMNYAIEAGFLAEQLQRILNFRAEATWKAEEKKRTITLIVEWDSKDPIQ
ncbi:MAG: DUF2507 domain-containing protein [Bacilli bacterium]